MGWAALQFALVLHNYSDLQNWLLINSLLCLAYLYSNMAKCYLRVHSIHLHHYLLLFLTVCIAILAI